MDVTLEEENLFFVEEHSGWIWVSMWKIHREWIWVQLKKECCHWKELPLEVIGLPLEDLGYQSDEFLNWPRNGAR